MCVVCLFDRILYVGPSPSASTMAPGFFLRVPVPVSVSVSVPSQWPAFASLRGLPPSSPACPPMSPKEIRRTHLFPAAVSWNLGRLQQPKQQQQQQQHSDDNDEDEDGFPVDLDKDQDDGGKKEVERRLVSGDRVLQITKADFTVSSILDKIRRGKLDLRPSYQRDYVWDKRTASKLIESVLLNIPLPTMFFHERSQGQLEVVDGRQRLTSIWCYMEEGKFPDGSDFVLVGLDVLNKLNGKKYSDLNESLREAMQDFALNVHTISRHSDDEVVFEVFERLNMGSTQLNEQELRNCIFQGSYNDLLDELVWNPDMLQAFRQENPHKRMRDKEFILRFFALRRGGVENFFLPVKNWLNNEIRRYQFLEETETNKMTADFEHCISVSVKVFGDQVFRLPRSSKYDQDVNACLWDTIMHGFLDYRDTREIAAKASELSKAFDVLAQESDFRSNLFSTPKSLRHRTHKWAEVLKSILGEKR